MSDDGNLHYLGRFLDLRLEAYVWQIDVMFRLMLTSLGQDTRHRHQSLTHAVVTSWEDRTCWEFWRSAGSEESSRNWEEHLRESTLPQLSGWSPDGGISSDDWSSVGRGERTRGRLGTQDTKLLTTNFVSTLTKSWMSKFPILNRETQVSVAVLHLILTIKWKEFVSSGFARILQN